MKVIAKIMYAAVLKAVCVSAHARNHVICQRCRKCLIALVFDDVDLPYCTSKAENIVAFTTIFSNFCTAHAQKRLFMNFRFKFRYRRSIPGPRFPVTAQNVGYLAMFLRFFAFYMLNFRHISTSGVFDLLT